MREGGELLEMWKALGITADKHVAFYCGTGWRASETYCNRRYNMNGNVLSKHVLKTLFF